jgi:hypothetical protein
MKKPPFYFVVLLIAALTVAPSGQALGGPRSLSAAPAQGAHKPTPQFTLTISELHKKDSSPGSRWVRIAVTNTSNEKLLLDGCAVACGFYKVTVVYDGVALEEQDAVARRLLEDRMRHAIRKFGDIVLKPGESYDDRLPISFMSVTGPVGYDMSKPGDYEVTVERVASPEDSEKGITVRSNAITITVLPTDPQPPAYIKRPDESLTLRTSVSPTTGTTAFRPGEQIGVSLIRRNLTDETIYMRFPPQMANIGVLERANFEVKRGADQVSETERFEHDRGLLKNPHTIFAGLGPGGYDLSPGEIMDEVSVPISDYYDMSVPGVYRIVAYLVCDQCDSEPQAKSNAITITVLPAGDQTQK